MSGFGLLGLAFLGGCNSSSNDTQEKESIEEFERRLRDRVDQDGDFYVIDSFATDYPQLYEQFLDHKANHPDCPFAEGDCLDSNDQVNPGMSETPDGLDNDCSGIVDDHTVAYDDDGDGYSENEGDCDDANVSLNPGEIEVCDGLDNNCNTQVDEGVTTTAFIDADGDGYGDQYAVEEEVCDLTGYSLTNDDCDDIDFTKNPGMSEDVDLIGDENCDGFGQGSLSYADSFFEGDSFVDYTGFSMANVGDMNGDGIPDVLVGAPSILASQPYGTGEAKLLLGDSTNFWNAGSEYTHTGETTEDFAGVDVASVGDMNGDGIDDIAIGASYEDTNGSNSGATYLFYGPYTGDRGLGSADFILYGTDPSDRSGQMIQSAGDFNCDGNDDLLIGSAYNDDGGPNSGQAYVVYGPLSTGSMSLDSADVTITGATPWNLLGESGSAADLNGDGCSEIAIGAPFAGPSGEGQVYIFEGSPSPLSTMDSSMADATFTGSVVGGELGSNAVIKDGADLTGDGNPDLVIGARYHNCGGTDTGAVYVVDDPLTSATLSTSAAAFICGDGVGNELGFPYGSIDIGDLDGDGIHELLIGNEGHGIYYGAAFLFMGPVSGSKTASDAEQILTGEVAGAGHVGRSAIFVDDINGDGILEIGLGDPMTGASAEGRSYIIDGSRLIP